MSQSTIRKRLENRKHKQTKAFKERDAMDRQKRYQKSEGRKNSGKKWAEWEIEMLFNLRYIDAELSVTLQRSLRAVRNARYTYARFAPPGWEPKGQKRLEPV